MHESPSGVESRGGSPDLRHRSTRRLVIDLAVVEHRLRSVAARRAHCGPTPHGVALQDQLEADEREILLMLRRRRLSFRAVVTDGDVPLAGPGGSALTW